MNNRVSNGVFGKIVRTLGFILLLAASVLILSQLVIATSDDSIFASLKSYAQMVPDNIPSSTAVIWNFAYLGLVVGLLFLVWSLRKGIILRLLISILLVFVFGESIANGTILFTGVALDNASFLNSAISSVSSYIDQVVSASPYVVPGASVLLALFLWFLFANKKPKRMSVQVVRAGSIFLLLAVLVAALPAIVSSGVFTAVWFITIETALYVLAYVLFIIGSVLGILGFARS